MIVEADIEQIAHVCHEANAALCRTVGDNSQKSWDKAEEWQRQSAINGVKFALGNLDAPAAAQHDAWMSDKEKAGWKFGPIKDPDKKEHPCMVPYIDLPLDQRLKDHLFKAVVRAFVDAINREPGQ